MMRTQCSRSRQSKQEQKCTRLLLKELPYFNLSGNLPLYYGQFNNSLASNLPTKRNLECLPCLYDLDLFSTNSTLDENLNPDNNLEFPRVQCRYFSPHSFKEYGSSFSLNQRESSLSFFHNNIVSLNKNLDNLVDHYLDELDFHFNVIGITETKITKSNEPLCNFQIPGYNFEQVPTPLVSGGVGLFIDDTLSYIVLEKTSTEAFQALWVEFSFLKQKNIICGIIYRQHNSPDLFLNYINDTLERLNSTGKRICLLGDFNMCLLKTSTSHYSHDFLTTLQSNYLIPTIDKPTRVHRTTATLIDNIFVNNPEQVLMSGNIITDVSDHFSQFCILSSAKEKSNIKKTIRKRDFSHFSSESFNSDLSAVDWENILLTKSNNIDDLFSTFFKRVNNIVNKHAPIKNLSKRKIKQLAKPWITKGLKTSIKVKNKLYVMGDPTQYTYYRNRITTLTRLSKQKYYANYFLANINNMKKTWQVINKLLTNRKRKSHTITALKDPRDNNLVTHNPSRIPNILNEHFATIGNKLTMKLSPRSNYMDYLAKSKSPDSSFLFQPVSPNDVKFQILSLSNNKSHGLYSCPAQLLKCASNIFSPILAEIFNTSISLGAYPSKLKLSKITAIFKSDDETDALNYRPISLLSNFNKIFEKIMYNRMVRFIEEHSILYPSQYGFRKGHSTHHAIIDILEAIQSNMDRRLITCGIFIDLKKAFDTVNHKILLDKLNHYGFRGIINDWFRSYLTDRTQTTLTGSHISEKCVCTCGVPQGSVLGPLLFLLYVNDIHNCSSKLKFFLFADDTNITFADKNLKTLEVTVNNEIGKLNNWLTSNKLTLNTKKN